MADNRIDRAIQDVNGIVRRNLRQYEAEADYARAERGELSARDRAELNSLIDEQREQDRLADEDYADRMLERMDEDRFDR